jgi:hypothetical protein
MLLKLLEVIIGGLQEMWYSCGHLNKSMTPHTPPPHPPLTLPPPRCAQNKYPTLLGTWPCYVLNCNFQSPKEGVFFFFLSVKKVVSFHVQGLLRYCSSIFPKILDVERKNKIYTTSSCGGGGWVRSAFWQGHYTNWARAWPLPCKGPCPSKNALILGHYPLTLNLKTKIGLI